MLFSNLYSQGTNRVQNLPFLIDSWSISLLLVVKVVNQSEWFGRKYVGEHKDGKFNGQGTYTYADGSKYVGEYKDDKRDGQGTTYFSNSEKRMEKVEGEYKDGEMSGQMTITRRGGGTYTKYM